MPQLALVWPYDREYMQLALAAGVAIGASAPLVGTFLVQKRMSLMGDGIGHIAFAGVAVGLLVGVWPVWSALVLAVAGAAGVEWLRTRRQASGDLALALLLYSGVAGGVVLSGVAGRFDATILSYLFGSLLTVSRGDAATVVALGLVVATILAVSWRLLFTVVLDEEAARVAGLPVDALNLLLAALAAVTVVAAMRVVGLLLVAALMVLPVGAAQLVARSFRGTLVLGSACGAGATFVGLGIARAAGLPAGGTIVLVAAAVFALTAVVSQLRGAGGAS